MSACRREAGRVLPPGSSPGAPSPYTSWPTLDPDLATDARHPRSGSRLYLGWRSPSCRATPRHAASGRPGAAREHAVRACRCVARSGGAERGLQAGQSVAERGGTLPLIVERADELKVIRCLGQEDNSRRSS